MCVFAPRNASEFARVIAPGGRLVVAIPGAEHLAGLRDKFGLIGIEADKAAKIEAQLGAEFELDARQALGGSAALESEALMELISMTPNARHMDDEKKTLVDSAQTTEAEFRFEILVFKRA